ncbi:MAG: radical SAM protein [Thermodesulfobacteriota bacterium]
MLIPKHVQIETLNGACTARCVMCTFPSWTRKSRVMSIQEFRGILYKFKPYVDKIQFLTLHGCGEPLLDLTLADKVRIAKELGFRGAGFASNCTELNDATARRLLEAGLDTIICSVDGLTKDTHEAIRVGTDFSLVVSNVQHFIQLRNECGRTRVLVRFICQQENEREWPEFKEYWESQLNKKFGDSVLRFDIHNWGGKDENYGRRDVRDGINPTGYLCRDVFDRMLIYSDGSVGLCCADDNGFYDLGNVLNSDPREIYNGAIFRHYRRMILENRTRDLEHCATCTVPRSRHYKT